MTRPSNKYEIEKQLHTLLQESAAFTGVEKIEFIQRTCDNNPDLLQHCLNIYNRDISDDELDDIVFKDGYKGGKQKIVA